MGPVKSGGVASDTVTYSGQVLQRWGVGDNKGHMILPWRGGGEGVRWRLAGEEAMRFNISKKHKGALMMQAVGTERDSYLAGERSGILSRHA